MDRKTVMKYTQILRELTLIKYGRRQDEGGRISGSYLVLFEYIPFSPPWMSEFVIVIEHGNS